MASIRDSWRIHACNEKILVVFKAVKLISVVQSQIFGELLSISRNCYYNGSGYVCWRRWHRNKAFVTYSNVDLIYLLCPKSNCKVANVIMIQMISIDFDISSSSHWSQPWDNFFDFNIVIIFEID